MSNYKNRFNIEYPAFLKGGAIIRDTRNDYKEIARCKNQVDAMNVAWLMNHAQLQVDAITCPIASAYLAGGAK